MKFEEFWKDADIFDSSIVSCEEVWDAAYNAAIDEAVKVADKNFYIKFKKGFIETIKQLKEAG